jgi:alcohol dehydrogenase (cytochrome c)
LHNGAIESTARAVTVNEDIVLKEAGPDLSIGPTFTGGRDWPSGGYNPKTNAMFIPLQNLCFDTVPRWPIAIRRRNFVSNVPPLGTRQRAVNAISAETGKTLWSYPRDELLARAWDCRRSRVQLGPLPARLR